MRYVYHFHSTFSVGILLLRLVWFSILSKMSIRVIKMLLLVLTIVVAMAKVIFAQKSGGGGGYGIAQGRGGLHDVVSNCDKPWLKNDLNRSTMHPKFDERSLNLCPWDHDSTFKVPDMKSSQPLGHQDTYIVEAENSNVKSAIIVIICWRYLCVLALTCTLWSPL